MPGVDLVLPDLGWLAERHQDVDGIVLTHGHEDHVGALAYLLRTCERRSTGPPFTLGIARNRLEEANLAKSANLVTVHDGERRSIGPFEVEFIPSPTPYPMASPSPPHRPGRRPAQRRLQARSHACRRPAYRPARIGQISSSEGIRLLLSDSTNAEEPGFTGSERSVGESLRGDLFCEP